MRRRSQEQRGEADPRYLFLRCHEKLLAAEERNDALDKENKALKEAMRALTLKFQRVAAEERAAPAKRACTERQVGELATKLAAEREQNRQLTLDLECRTRERDQAKEMAASTREARMEAEARVAALTERARTLKSERDRSEAERLRLTGIDEELSASKAVMAETVRALRSQYEQQWRALAMAEARNRGLLPARPSTARDRGGRASPGGASAPPTEAPIDLRSTSGQVPGHRLVAPKFPDFSGKIRGDARAAGAGDRGGAEGQVEGAPCEDGLRARETMLRQYIEAHAAAVERADELTARLARSERERTAACGTVDAMRAAQRARQRADAAGKQREQASAERARLEAELEELLGADPSDVGPQNASTGEN
jgi:chromosome segregation ATPase